MNMEKCSLSKKDAHLDYLSLTRGIIQLYFPKPYIMARNAQNLRNSLETVEITNDLLKANNDWLYEA